MGSWNYRLIQDAEHVRKARGEDSPEFKKVVALVEESQALCPHTAKCLLRAKTPSPTGLIQPGDEVVWCAQCSLPLKVNGVAWETLRQSRKKEG